MSAKPIQMYSGSDAVRAAEAYRLAIEARRNEWPYVHVYPPPNSQDVTIIRSAATEDLGTQTEVLLYKVSAGKRFFLTGVILGANVAIVPGQALFTVDRNSPIGVPNTQFMPEHGLVNVGVQLGSTTFGKFHLERAREFSPNDVIRVKATNVALSVGDPNFFVCGIFGYEVPTLDVRPKK